MSETNDDSDKDSDKDKKKDKKDKKDKKKDKDDDGKKDKKKDKEKSEDDGKKDKKKDKDKSEDDSKKDKKKDKDKSEDDGKRDKKKDKDKADSDSDSKSEKKDKKDKEKSDPGSPLEFQPTCDMFDKYEDSARVPAVCWRNLGGKQQFCGWAVTVKCFEDNSRVKELVATPGNDHVMVIDGGGSMRHALLGDQLAELAATNKWAGVIVYGCVRDAAALAKVPLGVLALGTTPRKSVRREEGQMDLPVRIGDVMVNPGDLVYADEDGVLVLSPDDIEAAASKE